MDMSDHAEALSALIEDFSRDIPLLSDAQQSSHHPARCVAITGTTGFLGRALLQRLLLDESITKIYCLNRSDVAHQTFTKSLRSSSPVFDAIGKVQFCTAYIGEKQLGLSRAKYAELVRDVDAIVHSAWATDHGLDLHYFRYPHLRGLRHLVDLSIESTRRPRIVFLSSAWSVGRWKHGGQDTQLGDDAQSVHPPSTIPEQLAPAPDVASSTGYAASKQVAEQLLSAANKQANVPVTILRLGQVLCAARAPRNRETRTWLPALIRASVAMKLLPTDMPDTQCLPASDLADITADLLHCVTRPLEVYHVLSPHRVVWSELIPALHGRLGPGVELVPFAVWIDSFRESQNKGTATGMLDKKGLEALEVFINYTAGADPAVSYDTTRACAASRRMSGLVGAMPGVVERWMHDFL